MVCQEGSDSEQESNDGVGIPRKPHKRTRGKVQPNPARNLSDVPQSQSVASSYGCLSLLKKKRSGGKSYFRKYASRILFSFVFS